MSSLAFSQPQAATGQPQPGSASRGSVLVVDDEPAIAEVVARYLERAGYVTDIASDGPTAMHAVAALRPDLVVLDVKLPRIDGLEVLRLLRREDHSYPAVILLSGNGQELDRVIGLRSGADDYVVKPFSTAELVARVDAVMRRAAPRPPERVAGSRSEEGIGCSLSVELCACNRVGWLLQ